MKAAIKRENYEFLVIPLKHIMGLPSLANLPGTQKLWAITHENWKKHENDEFLVISPKHVSGLKVILNRPGTSIM